MKGRIPQHFIDDLLSRVDIVEVVDRRVPLRKAGRNYTARCPFHEEKTPSFSVSPDKQFYYCFGCGASGNALGFLMEYERQDFPQAVESLASQAGLEVPREQRSEHSQQREQQRRDLYSLMDTAAAWYTRALREHPQRQRAVDYLKKRGLSGEIARDFDIGFAPPGWDNLLKALGSDEESRRQLIDTGMAIEKEDGKLYDRFRDRIMFPIRDNRGRIIAFGGRVLGDEKPKYLNSPETGIFHKGEELYGLYQARRNSRNLQRLLIVEGYMDVVALAQHGIHCAVATLGTATSIEHLRKVFRYCSEVVFCFDGDEAGRKAARRALETALPALEDGRQARFLFLPEGEDPDTLVRSLGAAKFQHLVERAQPLEDYLFAALAEQANPDTLEGKAKLSKLASPLIQQLPEGVYKQLMLDALAQRTGLSRDALNQVLAQNPPAPPPEPLAPGPVQKRQPLPPVVRDKRDAVLWAIALLLHYPRALLQIEDTSALDTVDNPNIGTLRAIIELLRKRPESSSAMLLGHWHGLPEQEVLGRSLRLDTPYEENKAVESLKEAMSRFFPQRHSRGRYQEFVERLKKDNDFSKLTEEEKALLKKPPHLS